ncbi:MAG TPA: DUF3795 domain-containing protein, partial [Bacillota bacterium]|nr:DUF3795 domain-containing protein [Bacillota bacterium]
CGLFCPSCTIFIGSTDEPERLSKLANRLGQSVESTRCAGCRSEKRTGYCQTCKMAACIGKKGFKFCIECEEYPCAELKSFQGVYAHRIELWKWQERIKEAGYEQWFHEMIEHFSCPECHTINSAFDIVCRKCGNEPSCNYVKVNQQAIIDRNLTKTLNNN